MKKISSYLLTVALIMATTQITKGQTFDLGLAAQDSAMVKLVESLRSIGKKGPILFELIKTASDKDSVKLQPDDQNKKLPDDPEGGTRGKYYTNMHPHILNTFSINTGKSIKGKGFVSNLSIYMPFVVSEVLIIE